MQFLILYIGFYRRWQQILKQGKASTRTAEATSRISVGLGTESVLETSVSLHRTYGVPYIPGSALKGLAASYMRQKLLPKPQKGQEKEATEEERQWVQASKIIFGDTNEAGYITFYDALYIPPKEGEAANKPLYPDVITVHHPKYYQGGEVAPADWDSPIPVPFPSAYGRYLIALSAPDLAQAVPWIEMTFDILGEAFKTMGIGAKTSSGYGRLKYITRISAKAQEVVSEIARMPQEAVNQGIQKYYGPWQKFTLLDDRIAIAQAIVNKVRMTGYEPRKVKVAWYQELLGFIEQNDELD